MVLRCRQNTGLCADLVSLLLCRGDCSLDARLRFRAQAPELFKVQRLVTTLRPFLKLTHFRITSHSHTQPHLLLNRTLVGEGHVDAMRVYGPEGNAAIVTLKASAPGGARQCKVRVVTYSVFVEAVCVVGCSQLPNSGVGCWCEDCILVGQSSMQ